MNLINTLTFPIRVLLDQNTVKQLGLNTLAKDRVNKVLPFIKGKLLDIGCGENLLIRQYNSKGVGVDVYPWKDIDVLCHTHKLPFQNHTFDTVSMLASINHVPRPIRPRVLKEAFRVLKPAGNLILTTLDPKIGWACHKLIASWDPDQTTRGIASGEEWGLDESEVIKLLKKAKFTSPNISRFSFLHLNTIYLATKA